MTNPTLNKAAAEAVDRITLAVLSAAWESYTLMRESGAWKHLGYQSFEEWASSQSKPQLGREERKVLVAELAETTDMTQREIAATVGVGFGTVNRDLAELASVPDGTNGGPVHAQDGAPRVPNGTSDPEHWVALTAQVKALRAMSALPAEDVAESVPERRRQGTAKALCQLGTYLGSIALRPQIGAHRVPHCVRYCAQTDAGDNSKRERDSLPAV